MRGQGEEKRMENFIVSFVREKCWKMPVTYNILIPSGKDERDTFYTTVFNRKKIKTLRIVNK